MTTISIQQMITGPSQHQSRVGNSNRVDVKWYPKTVQVVKLWQN
ncbi:MULTISPECIES: hypothetical protein [Nitrosomonas]|uniref:Uncharacterized protein n=1 Tax=Nitrosomonas communis TaxID=44574 RepID=A0A5D3Y9X6_9PROT|nr:MULTISPECIES: hypothetical protein [Nitrosomonas]TYP74184.1 hypothetical protein BCL69_109014 [Nitrosomonas communis]UVS62557.1 hypothetical protein NX761_05400 [Nitrosomonas sp. PLL12]